MNLVEGNLFLILIAVICYILGSIPVAYVVTKVVTGKDVRRSGSGNIGAMNTYRVIRAERSTGLAIAGFVIALLGDLGKGVLAVFVARWLDFLNYDLTSALIVSSFFVVLGHNYCLFFRFKQGGRGLSSMGGVVLALNPLAFLVGLGVLILSIILAQYLLVGRINWGRFSEVFSVIGSQIVGRVIGLAVALVPIYFFGLEVFLPALAAMHLVWIRHVGRVRAYIRDLRASGGRN